MRPLIAALGFWLLLCAFALLWVACGVWEFLARPRWPRARRAPLAETFDPVRALRR